MQRIGFPIGSVENLVFDPKYKIDFASLGKIGIEKLQNKRYDLIITDVNLIDMDGVELVTTRIKKGEFGEKSRLTPIIIFTGGRIERAVKTLGQKSVFHKSPLVDFRQIIENSLPKES